MKLRQPQFRYRGAQAPKAGVRAQILVRNEDGEVDTSVATMRLYDVIDSWGGEWGISARDVAAALDEIPDAKQINLHINSPGGDAFEGVAIMNQLRRHPANVTAVVDGLAASAASFIAAGMDEFVMAENSTAMIHDAWGICLGNAADMADMAGMLNKVSDNIAAVYAARSGDVKTWRKAMQAESWYTADEAVAAGLADRVEGAGDAAAANRFDLSVFAYAGRAKAPAPRAGCDCGPAVRGIQHKNECPTRVRAAATDDASMLTQALGWLSAIDNIVDEAQETISTHLGIDNPDADEGDDQAAANSLAAARRRHESNRHRMNAQRLGLPA